MLISSHTRGRISLRCCALTFQEKVVTVPLAAKLHWGPIESDLDPSIFYCRFIDAGAE